MNTGTKGKIKITAVSDSLDLRVFINGTVHLYIKKEKLVSFQSWYENDYSCKIEFTFESGAEVLMEYNSVEKWKTIIELLNKHI